MSFNVGNKGKVCCITTWAIIAIDYGNILLIKMIVVIWEHYHSRPFSLPPMCWLTRGLLLISVRSSDCSFPDISNHLCNNIAVITNRNKKDPSCDVSELSFYKYASATQSLAIYVSRNQKMFCLNISNVANQRFKNVLTVNISKICWLLTFLNKCCISLLQKTNYLVRKNITDCLKICDNSTVK